MGVYHGNARLWDPGYSDRRDREIRLERQGFRSKPAGMTELLADMGITPGTPAPPSSDGPISQGFRPDFSQARP